MIPAAAALAAALAAVSMGVLLRRQAPQPIRKESMTAAEQESAAPYQFLLKSEPETQTLTLFHLQEDGWKKLAAFPVVLTDLPETDQQLLQTGLAIQDAQELQLSLEDYLPSS